MDSIKWCKEQGKGIKQVIPNSNLADSYLKRAKLDYDNLKNQNSVWKVVVSYYACYNAFYSVLSRYGIKCEIHSCTLLLLPFFSHLKGYYEFLFNLKENRTNTQYYLKEPEEVDLAKIKGFIDACELELLDVNQDKINSVIKRIFGEKT